MSNIKYTTDTATERLTGEAKCAEGALRAEVSVLDVREVLDRLATTKAAMEESDRDWASYFEGIGSHVGDPEFTQVLAVKLLRGPRPFGTKAGN